MVSAVGSPCIPNADRDSLCWVCAFFSLSFSAEYWDQYESTKARIHLDFGTVIWRSKQNYGLIFIMESYDFCDAENVEGIAESSHINNECDTFWINKWNCAVHQMKMWCWLLSLNIKPQKRLFKRVCMFCISE